MALLHGATATVLAKYEAFNPTGQTLMVSFALAVLVGAAAGWSAVDAWRGQPDRGKNWFIAALIAGPVSGVLYVIGRAVFVDQTGVSALGDALTSDAAFSALLVLIPAGIGLFAGSKIAKPRQDQEDDEEETQPASGKPAG